ncbi:16S rRNA (cytosine(1402)-N(4))-methyltransferase RsmH [Desulfovibrio ferrophilus]|uniref:Ribosomal RNA small subunit methyltransferase H n=1 Tax=Desulfovibrio ferrophilus TaxID=241368 RepID=A0A2Z6AZ76_9BACT|nr:16S rRNA (cytosine(1402)-N(4))-methyltransferase RsmH [Desulfovibrio ferrophilus]BBD08552.1 16S rRNA m(4)C1402 methyltransferase [Desulfovibrio ferrophilus]
MSEQDQKSPADRHIPVLFEEVMEYLEPTPGGRYLDGTLGMGGHTEGIMMRSDGKAEVLGLDRDQQALELAAQRLERFGERVSFAQSRFSEFEGPLHELGWDSLDGALIDIGVSSLQLDDPERGFSFIQDGPLDMRMGHADGQPPASSIVNKASFEQLKMIIGRYGEEPQGGRIARAIIEARFKKPIETTLELAALVENAYPAKLRATARNHPATRTFQALRMEVNRELDELQEYLNRILPFLKPGARLAVISFHSLEDRIVKRMFQKEAKGCLCPREVPICQCGHVPQLKILTKKPVTAGESERESNPRARSAKLRVAERLASPTPEA